MQRDLLAVTIASSLAVVLAAGCGGSGNGCYTVSGTGSTEVCAYVSSDTPGFTCSEMGANGTGTSGSCPSSGLVGCCVHNISAGGYNETTADCYYSAATAKTEMASCPTAGGTWQTSAP